LNTLYVVGYNYLHLRFESDQIEPCGVRYRGWQDIGPL